jgi:YidC/Oxa1 family membrane protein insertase
MNKRFFLAMGLWLLIVISYFALKAWLFPPPPPPQVLPPHEVPAELAELRLPVQLQPLLNLHLVLADQVQTLAQAAQKRAEEQQQREERLADIRRQQEQEWVRDPLVLGSPQYKLLVTVSRFGAALRQVQLNAYRAADPATARPSDRPLVLLHDDFEGDLGSLPVSRRLELQSYRMLVDDLPLAWEHLPELDRRDDQGNLMQVSFQAFPAGKNIRIVRTFSLAPGDYHVGLCDRFEALAEEGKAELRYVLTGARGVPVEGKLWKTMPFRQIVTGTVRPGGGPVRYLVTAQELRDDLPRPENQRRVKSPPIGGDTPPERLQFCGVMLQFFASLAVVDGDPNQTAYIEKVEAEYLGDDLPVQLHGVDWPVQEKFQGRICPRLVSRVLRPTQASPIEHRWQLYCGPTKVLLLKYQPGVAPETVQNYYQRHLNIMTDYPWWSIFAYGWTQVVVFCTDLMHWLLIHLAWLCGGHHWAAIILMTVLVRLTLFPISRKQALASLRMQKMAPELKALQEKFKNNRQALAEAQMELYRKYGINPFGGCLIVLLQMPVLMGLYYALYESVDLRLSGFLWIENLAAPDMLFYWGSWPLVVKQVTSFLSFGYIVINLGPYFHLLPVVSTVLLLVQQKLLTPPPTDEVQAQQQQMFKVMMVLMGYAFYWIASGLCLYFIVSSTWGMLERQLIPKALPGEAPPAGKPSAAEKDKRSRLPSNGSADGLLGNVKRWFAELLKEADKKK